MANRFCAIINIDSLLLLLFLRSKFDSRPCPHVMNVMRSTFVVHNVLNFKIFNIGTSCMCPAVVAAAIHTHVVFSVFILMFFLMLQNCTKKQLGMKIKIVFYIVERAELAREKCVTEMNRTRVGRRLEHVLVLGWIFLSGVGELFTRLEFCWILQWNWQKSTIKLSRWPSERCSLNSFS